MNTVPHYDVVIIGGGLIGSVLAASLRHLPLKIALVEARTTTAVATANLAMRPIALSYGTRRIFDTLGMWPALQDAAIPIKTVHISERGRYGTTVVTAASAGVPAFGYVCPAQQIQRVVTENCAAASNVTTYAPAQLREIQHHDDYSDVVLQLQDSLLTLRASLIVGADGRRSATRDLLNIGVREYNYAQTAVVTHVTLNRGHQNTAYERFTDQGPLAMLPLAEQQAGVVWSVASATAAELLQRNDRDFLAALQHAFGYRLGRLQGVAKRESFPLTLTLAKQTTAKGAVLLGDAAQALHPVAGQGYNLGMRDVAVLAEVIRDASNARRSLHNQQLLTAYSEQRRFDRQRTIWFSDFVSRIFIPDFLPLAIARDVGLCTVDMLPILKRGFVQQNMGMLGALPDLMCGVPV